MAISVAYTGSAALSSSRSPGVTFATYSDPTVGDVVVLWCSNTTNVGATIVSGWTYHSGQASDSHHADCISHVVTAADVTAGTITYQAVNFLNGAATGNTLGVVLRGVDLDYYEDSHADSNNSANTATPHILPALAGAELLDNSLILGMISKDGTGTWTTPTGWTSRVSSNTNMGAVIYSRDALTTQGVNTTATNVTPSAGDEYCATTIAFVAKPTAGAKLGTLTASFSTAAPDAYEDFTGANSTTSAGANWTNQVGQVGISSNKVYGALASNQVNTATHSFTPSGDDMAVEAVVSGSNDTTSSQSLILGSSSANQVFVAMNTNAGNNFIGIYTAANWNLGSSTNRLAIVGGVTDGALVRFARTGNVYRVYTDGILRGTWVDSGNVHPRNSSNRTCGVHFYNATATNNARFDNFKIIDAANAWEPMAGEARATGGQASLPPGSSLDTSAAYDLTSSSGYIEVPNPATTDATETWFSLNRTQGSHGDLGLYFRIHRGNIYFGEADWGTLDETPLTYDSTNHRWLKFSESGGTITWSTSPDGTTWTSRRTKTAGFSVLTAFYVGLANKVNQTIFTDDFNRADSTTTLGTNWVNRTNNVGILSNQAYQPLTVAGGSAASCTTTPSGDDVRESVTITGMDSTQEANIALGASTSGNLAHLCVSAGSPTIRTQTAGVWATTPTVRATGTGTHVNGDRWSFERIGSVYTGYQNGTSVVTWNDTAPVLARNSTQRLVALQIYHNTTGVGAVRYDDYVLEDLSLTSSTVVMDNLNATPGFTGTSVAKVSVLGAAASGAQTQTGTSVVVLRSIAAAAAGAMAPSGAAASALQILTASASGAQAQIGTSASVLQRLVAAAAGTQTQTGTSAATLQRLVAAAAGQMEPSGTSATTLQKLVAASSGAQEQTGTSAAALRALTASAAGAMAPVGVGAATLRSLVAAASGTQTQTGTSATTLQRLVAAAAGVMPPSGTGSATLSALTAAAAGAQAQTGTSQAAIQKLVASASGVMAPSGVSDVALRALTVVAAGIQEQSGVATAVLRALTASASGAMTPSGAGAASLQPLVATAAGAQAQTGTSASALPALTAAALGAMAPSGTSDAALRALVAAAAGEALGTGTGVVSLRPLAAAASGEQKLTGTAAAALRALTASALGAQTFTGTSASVLQKLVAAASGEQKVTGTSAASLQALVAAAAGAQTQTGTAAAALRVLTAAAAGELAANIATAVLTPLQASATGSQPSDGTSGAVLQKLVAAATGAQPFSGSAEATLRAVQAGAGGMVMNSDFSAVRMLIVAREDRTLVVAVAERELNVGAANRTTVIVADDRTVIWAAEGREVEAVTEAREFIVEGMHDDLEVNTEDRSVIIDKSDRETVVAVEDRTYRVPAEDRTVRWTADELLVVDP